MAIGRREALSSELSDEEWDEMIHAAGKQALLGIGLAGIERLPAHQFPPRRNVCQWMGKAQKRTILSGRLDKGCEKITSYFAKAGFEACVLKGQSNLMFYPEWLKDKRTAGDIDVWVRPKDAKEKNPVRKVIRFCSNVKKGTYVYYHHLDFPVLEKHGIEVEVHYRPTWMFAPWRNRQLLKFIDNCDNRCVMKQEDNPLSFPVASVEFNIVYQLLHIYKHLFQEGIGLRQLLDYYFLLIYYMEHSTEKQRQETVRWMKRIGVCKFMGAVMFVLREVFALEDKYLLCPISTKDGEFLLSEIMIAGNFGKFDERIGHGLSGFGYAWMKLKRNLRFLTSYPEEVVCEPFFRFYHFLWRCWNNR